MSFLCSFDLKMVSYVDELWDQCHHFVIFYQHKLIENTHLRLDIIYYKTTASNTRVQGADSCGIWTAGQDTEYGNLLCIVWYAQAWCLDNAHCFRCLQIISQITPNYLHTVYGYFNELVGLLVINL